MGTVFVPAQFEAAVAKGDALQNIGSANGLKQVKLSIDRLGVREAIGRNLRVRNQHAVEAQRDVGKLAPEVYLKPPNLYRAVEALVDGAQHLGFELVLVGVHVARQSA